MLSLSEWYAEKQGIMDARVGRKGVLRPLSHLLPSEEFEVRAIYALYAQEEKAEEAKRALVPNPTGPLHFQRHFVLDRP